MLCKAVGRVIALEMAPEVFPSNAGAQYRRPAATPEVPNATGKLPDADTPAARTSHGRRSAAAPGLGNPCPGPSVSRIGTSAIPSALQAPTASMRPISGSAARSASSAPALREAGSCSARTDLETLVARYPSAPPASASPASRDLRGGIGADVPCSADVGGSVHQG